MLRVAVLRVAVLRVAVLRVAVLSVIVIVLRVVIVMSMLVMAMLMIFVAVFVMVRVVLCVLQVIVSGCLDIEFLLQVLYFEFPNIVVSYQHGLKIELIHVHEGLGFLDVEVPFIPQHLFLEDRVHLYLPRNVLALRAGILDGRGHHAVVDRRPHEYRYENCELDHEQREGRLIQGYVVPVEAHYSFGHDYVCEDEWHWSFDQT